MEKTAKFIIEAMRMNPKARFYWDNNEYNYVMEVHKGGMYRFGGCFVDFEFFKDEGANSFYYVDNNNCRIYMLYLVYVD